VLAAVQVWLILQLHAQWRSADTSWLYWWKTAEGATNMDLVGSMASAMMVFMGAFVYHVSCVLLLFELDATELVWWFPVAHRVFSPTMWVLVCAVLGPFSPIFFMWPFVLFLAMLFGLGVSAIAVLGWRDIPSACHLRLSTWDTGRVAPNEDGDEWLGRLNEAARHMSNTFTQPLAPLRLCD
jgi:hypothetical protein